MMACELSIVRGAHTCDASSQSYATSTRDSGAGICNISECMTDSKNLPRELGLFREVKRDGAGLWRVALRRQGRLFGRPFYDASWGGEAQARSIARQYRDALVKQFGSRLQSYGRSVVELEQQVIAINQDFDVRRPQWLMVRLAVYSARRHRVLRLYVSNSGQPLRYAAEVTLDHRDISLSLQSRTLAQALGEMRERAEQAITEIHGRRLARQFMLTQRWAFSSEGFCETQGYRFRALIGPDGKLRVAE